MKTAVILHGIAKYWYRSLNSIYRYFDINNTDVFIHMWHMGDEWVKKLNSGNSSDIVFSPHAYLDYRDLSQDEIQRYYQPKKYLVEDINQFNNHFNKLRDELVKECTDGISESHSRNNSLISMYYGLYKSDQLRRQYEIENNFKYDVVVKMRFDSNVLDEHGNFDNEFAEHLIVTPNVLNIPIGFDYKDGDNPAINNNFWIGDSDTTYVASQVYLNMLSIAKQIKIYSSETFFGQHLINNNIDSKRIKTFVGING